MPKRSLGTFGKVRVVEGTVKLGSVVGKQEGDEAPLTPGYGADQSAS